MDRRQGTALLPLLLAATLLPALPPGAAADDGFAVEIHLERGDNTAIRSGQALIVEGTAPAGTTSDDIDGAELAGIEPDLETEQGRQAVPGFAFGRGPDDGSTWLRITDGRVEGRLVAGCLFAEPAPACDERRDDTPVWRVELDLTIGGHTVTSNRLRVDHAVPYFRGYELVDTDRVLAVFSQPVRNPDGDSVLDWTVTEDGQERIVTGVGGPRDDDCADRYRSSEDEAAGATGCTRTLFLLPAVDEDARPSVDPRPPANRPFYQDFAGNVADYSSDFEGIDTPALNRVRPPLPEIEAVDGEAPTGDAPRVAGNEREPVATVGNVREGHRVLLAVTRPDGSSFTTEADPFTAPSTGSHDITLPPLAGGPEGDGVYRVEANVADPHGNRSDEQDKAAARDDGSPSAVDYELDTVPPEILSASRTGAREVLVTLSEPVVPDGDAGRWQVDGADAVAEGAAATRTLEAPTDLSDDATVSWEPDGGHTYTDPAGNELPASDVPVAELPPVAAPGVHVPSGETYLAEDEVTVKGTAVAGLEVLVFAEGADEPVVSTTTDGATWSVVVPLPDDGRHRFEAAAREPDTDATSPRTRVPDVIRDTSDPQVDVTEPAQRPILVDPLDRRHRFAVGDDVTVSWTAEDPAPDDPVNPDHGDTVEVQMQLEGQDWDTLEGDHPYTPGEAAELSYTITETDLAGLADREARFRVRVTDLAGNVGQDVSFPILIVGDLVGYTPAYVDPTRSLGLDALIEVRFAEPVGGSVLPLDWHVDDELSTVPNVVNQAALADDGLSVRLRVNGVTDPNATPMVTYAPDASPDPLEGAGGRDVSRSARAAVDAVPPALRLEPPHAGPLNATTVTLRGSTDKTARPNTIRVFRADAAGNRVGGAIGSTGAGGGGSFQTPVALEPNRRNDFVVEAVDPAGNRSTPRGFHVVEDSIAPVVTITSPHALTRVSRTLAIRWKTDDAHPGTADLRYRVNQGPWRHLARGLIDDGRFDWDVPASIGDDDRFDIRVTATDRAGNAGSATVADLTTGLVPVDPPADPPTAPGETDAPDVLDRVVTTSERTVDVVFSETVRAAPAPAGFSIVAGPGVDRVRSDGATLTLELNADLETNRPLVAHNGAGVTLADSGEAVPAFRRRARRGFAFAVQGLGGAAIDRDRIRLSWVDERNRPDEVVRYDVRRDGRLVAELGPQARGWVDDGAEQTGHTYTITTVDDLERSSRPASTTVDPRAPNITPAGGFVLSGDGRLAVLLPPDAVDTDHVGSLDLRGPATAGDFGQVTPAYELTVEAADGGAPLEAFARYACLSYRPGRDALAGHEQARLVSLRLGGGGEEMATRAAAESATSCLLTPGTFALGRAPGATTRVFGPDPAVTPDRFATAVGLSQTAFTEAGVAVIARADDYPDALAAASLAEQIGGPILLARPRSLPLPTALELLRLGVSRVVIVGGTEAVGPEVEAALANLGLGIGRVAGATRYDTAVAIAERVGAFDDIAYVATGLGFADALSGSGPSATLNRPVLLTGGRTLPQQTLDGLRGADIRRVEILGGEAAISAGVEAALRDAGLEVGRVFGPERYSTSAALAEALATAGLLAFDRPVAASGMGDGRTSPDALASGPVAARFGSPLLLVPRSNLHPSVAETVRGAGFLRGILVSGGPEAIADSLRSALDDSAR